MFLQNVKLFFKCRKSLEARWSQITTGNVEAIDGVDGVESNPTMRQVSLFGTVVSTLPELYETAEVAKETFSSILSRMAAVVGIDDVNVTVAPLKGKERATEKAHDDYGKRDPGPGISWLYDIVRGMIICETQEKVCKVALYLTQKWTDFEVVRLKNRFKFPTPGGFRDINMNIQIKLMRNGVIIHHICELQIHLMPLKYLAIQLGSHNVYSFFRTYFRGNAVSLDYRLNLLEKLVQNDEDITAETWSLIVFVDGVIGSRDLDRMDCVLNLLKLMCEFSLCVRVQRAMLEVCEESFGSTHINFYHTLQNLAITLRAAGDQQGSRAMYEQALAGYEEILGQTDAITLSTMTNLGVLLSACSDFAASEAMHTKALEGYETLLGPNHPYTLRSVHNLAVHKATQRDYEAARSLYVRALEGYRDLYDDEHMETLRTMANLGDLLLNVFELKQAEMMLIQALKGFEKQLGLHHADTLVVSKNLGLLHLTTGDIASAKEILEGNLVGCEATHGLDHTFTTGVMILLGQLYGAMDDKQAAEGIVVKLIGSHSRTDIELSSLADSKRFLNMGLALAAAGNHAEAKMVFLRALKNAGSVMASIDVHRQYLFLQVAKAHEALGELSEARQCLQQILAKEEIEEPNVTSDRTTAESSTLVQAEPSTLGQAEPSILGQSEPSTLGQAEPSTLGQAEPSTLGQAEPSTLGQAEPSTLGQVQPEEAAEAVRVHLQTVAELQLTAASAPEAAVDSTDCEQADSARIGGSGVTSARLSFSCQQEGPPGEGLLGEARKATTVNPPTNHSTSIQTYPAGAAAFADEGETDPQASSVIPEAHLALGKLLTREMDFEAGLFHCRKAAAAFERMLGPSNQLTLEANESIGLALIKTCDFEGACAIFATCLKRREFNYGPGHQNTLQVWNNFGLALKYAMRHDEAKAAFQCALSGYEKLGWGNSVAATNAVYNLGHLLMNAGNIDKAKELLQQAYDAYEKVVGDTHINTLRALATLAEVAYLQRLKDEGDRLSQRAIDGYSATVGLAHPEAQRPFIARATYLLRFGMFEEARQLFDSVHAVFLKCYGKYHHETTTALYNLGLAAKSQGDMLTAQVSFKQVVDARTASTASGKRDEITLLATAALALVHQIAGEFEVAKDLYSDVLVGWQILGDLNNDGAISAKSELTNTLAEMGDCEQAQVMFEEALHAYEMLDGFGEMHEATLGLMQNMAMNLCSLSRDEEAETIYIRALSGFEATLGAGNLSTLAVCKNLGNLYYRRKNYTQALPLFVRIFERRQESLPSDHSLTLQACADLTIIVMWIGDLEWMSELMCFSVRGLELTYGPDHTKTIQHRENLWQVYLELQNLEGAKDVLTAIYDSLCRLYGPEESHTVAYGSRVKALTAAIQRAALPIRRELPETLAHPAHPIHVLQRNFGNFYGCDECDCMGVGERLRCSDSVGPCSFDICPDCVFRRQGSLELSQGDDSSGLYIVSSDITDGDAVHDVGYDG